MMRAYAFAIAAACCAPGTAAADVRAELVKLRAMDQRLADVAHRLTTANAALCRELAPDVGLAIGALDQYAPAVRDDARAALGFDMPVAVAAVAAGSAAERAGVRPGDSLIAVNGRAVAAPRNDRRAASSATRDAVLAQLTSEPADRPVRLTLSRGGQMRDVVVPASPACRAFFEVVIKDTLFAQADPFVVQISSMHFDRFDQDGIAVTAAHELAHLILHHRARLSAAGVTRGLGAKFGRSRRLTRQAEDEADRLSVHLLRNAGFDPTIAVTFWRKRLGDKAPGPLGHRTHAAPAERAAIIAAEIAAAPGDAAIPHVPPMLRLRDMEMQ